MGLLDSLFEKRLDDMRRKEMGLEPISLLGALKDKQFRSDVLGGFLDAANRGAIAGNLGGPVDLAALALRPLGYKVEKPIGGSEWIADKMQSMGLLGDKKNDLAEAIAGIALPVAATKVAPKVFAAEQAAIKNAMAPRPLNGPLQNQAGAIVWQGSPHKYDAEKLVRLADGTEVYVGGKFNQLKEVPPGAKVLQDFPLGRLRSEAIGTGEGAQAYGHGHYTAESPDIADGYRKALSTRTATVNGQEFPKGSIEWQAANSIAANGYQQALANAEQFAQSQFLSPAGKQQYADMATAIRSIGDGSVKDTINGNLYKIDLPDEHIAKMLDWDKPLSEQPQAVREALAEFPQNMQGSAAYQSLKYGQKPAGFSESGEPLFDGMAALRSIKSGGANSASDFLRQAGIPGIRYLDGGSRGAGAGTSNFVLFPGNEGLATILERNGQGLLSP